ncbi:MAG TPA: hypothetical protein VM285_10600 [Polyangia bacterium]|nr:hypothetical protein [Polyangia bacterium]
MRSTQATFLILAAGLGALACGNSEKLDPAVDRLGRASGPAEPGLPRPATMGPVGGGAATGGSGTVHVGKAVETIQVPNYTYIRLATADGNDIWTAVPSTEVSVGQEVRVVESLVMTEFTSRTLSRTFDRIVFGVFEGQSPPADSTAPPGPRGELPPGHPPIDAGPTPSRSAI